MRVDETLPPPLSARPRTLDKVLMGRIVDKIRSVYTELGQRVPDRQLGELAAEWYPEIAAAGEDPYERAMALGAMAERFQQELRRAASDPTTGKRQA